MKKLVLAGALATVLAMWLSVSSTTGCGGAEGDDCLGSGENCTSDYVEREYGDDRDCCSGMTCSEGPSSGVLICQR
jgi:hypothetical protein